MAGTKLMTQAAFLPVLVALASGASQSQDRQTTFRAVGRVIEVDAFVTDARGQFVSGLRRDEFEILEDGVRQELVTATQIELQAGPSRATASRSEGLTGDVVDNHAEGRVYVMLLDSWGLRVPERAYVPLEQMFRYTQRTAERFINDALQPGDAMAIVHVQGSRRDAQSFTRNKRLLRSAISRLTPEIDTPPGTSPPLPYCDIVKLRNTYDAITTISERLGALRATRKMIVWINGRVPMDPVTDCTGGAETMASGQAGIIAALHRDAIRAATQNNVAIYPIDAIGLTADPNVETPRDRPVKRLAALRSVAEDTGGEAIVNTNNFSDAFSNVVNATRAYYLLAYTPSQARGNAQFHEITVRVKRPGVRVSARRGYADPPDSTLPEAKVAEIAGVPRPVAEALLNPLPTNVLGLTVFAAPFRGNENNGSVVLAAAIEGLGRGDYDDTLTVGYLAIDQQARTRVAPAKVIKVPSNLAGADVDAVYVHDRLALPPGRHEIRMAVARARDRAVGSVMAYVEIPDFAREALAISGIALTSDRPQAAVSRDGQLEALLGGGATVRRQFRRSEGLSAFAEVYAGRGLQENDVRIEAALRTGDRVMLVREVVRTSTGSGRVGYRLRIALADLAPGEYVLSITARAGRRNVQRQSTFDVLE